MYYIYFSTHMLQIIFHHSFGETTRLIANMLKIVFLWMCQDAISLVIKVETLQETGKISSVPQPNR
jgi:hypothetical protein